MTKSTELPTLAFASKEKWTGWLAKQHAQSVGVWLKFAKKGTGIATVTYDEALEIALCYGWFDGQKAKFDDQFWLQKFTPRGPKSIWSITNKEKAEKLIANGEMKPAGEKAIALAKQNGRWDNAYAGQKTITVPDDFQAELEKSPKARAFFATLNSVNPYAILFRIHNAKKAETCRKRIEQFIEMLEKGQKLH